MEKVIVHQIPGAWGLASVSPFCLKLETYLKMADIPYESVVDAAPFNGPKKKLPWIEHRGNKMGDSGFIIEYLNSEFNCDLDISLTPTQKALAHSLRRLLEENLYWVIVYERWMVESNWRKYRDIVLGGIPQPLRVILAPVIRRNVKRQLMGHGLGKHSLQEVRAIGIKDMIALADVLEEKPFFMGETPTEIDAIAYSLLANILSVPIESPVKNAGLSHTNLVDFVARMASMYFK